MKDAIFTLHPFSPDKNSALFDIAGVFKRHADTLRVTYRMSGPIHLLNLPVMCNAPTRTNGLWESTCLECFIGGRTAAAYWEFNLSPAGHWNVYRFDSYRQGMRPEEAFKALPLEISTRRDTMRLALNIDLKKMKLAGQPIRLAISAVLVEAGLKSYWALTHEGDKPDFHNPKCFLLAF